MFHGKNTYYEKICLKMSNYKCGISKIEINIVKDGKGVESGWEPGMWGW